MNHNHRVWKVPRYTIAEDFSVFVQARQEALARLVGRDEVVLTSAWSRREDVAAHLGVDSDGQRPSWGLIG